MIPLDLDDERRFADVIRGSRTDVGNRDRFVRAYGDVVCHVAGVGWHVFTAGRWLQDDKLVTELAIAMTRHLATQADRTGDDPLSRHARASQHASRLRNMLSLAQSEAGIAKRAMDFDADPWLLGTPSGVVDLRAGTCSPGLPGMLISKQTAVGYDPEASAPRFLQFLNEIACGDQDLIDYLQRLMGYCLTGSVAAQRMWFLRGDGANGKSTLIKAITSTMGDYSTRTNPNLLIKTPMSSERHPTDLANLQGARLAVCSELGANDALNAPLLKQLTGGDAISGRRMRQDPYQFLPTWKLLVDTNHLPRPPDGGHALLRRLVVVPFDATFSHDDRTADPEPTLMAERAGILAWLVKGAVMYFNDGGLGTSRRVTAATLAYHLTADPVKHFVDKRCDVESGAKTSAASLHEAYKVFCEDVGLEPYSSTAFGRQLTTLGYRTCKSGIIMRMGLRLRQTENGEPSR